MNDLQANPGSWLTTYARQDFARAYRKSFWRSVISFLGKSDNDLLPFDEVVKRIPFKGQSYIGMKQIEDRERS
ncbi:MAG: hypothetical protein MZV49_27575 [Rhodopseudomonas palustris]|nr:hypothetical protein [Rhodopseudomonas palustris]